MQGTDVMKMPSWTLPAALAAALVAIVVVWGRQEHALPVAVPAVAPAAPATATTADAVLVQQRAAEQAATAAPEWRGPLAVRPDFVSPLEWQVLQAVAGQGPDHERVLTQLVNKLRFSKQLEQWRGSGAGAPRRALAATLLADVPARVAAGDMDAASARTLQGELLADLEPDPAVRARRAAAEAARLGTLLQPAGPR
jgi:hypothetical protein